MSILVTDHIFHLQTNDVSYIMSVNDSGVLCHLYYGNKIVDFINDAEGIIKGTNLEMLPQECASYGTGDFRTPTYEILQDNGSSCSELHYTGYAVSHGKKPISGLPSSYCIEEDQTETLSIMLNDYNAGFCITLVYTIFPSYNVITRSTIYQNTGEKNENIVLNKALSMSMDFQQDSFDMLQFSGAWSREKHMYRRAIVPGIQAIDSKRGISSAVQNPFIALLSKDASEDFGEVYAYNLVYSGNFLAEVEVSQFKDTRISMGINPFNFSWKLRVGESFETPEVVMVYSNEGLGKMSRIYHKFYRERMCRGTYQYKERPILINNWEATYFNFDENKIYDLAMAGKELGIELFVLDDGWFGHRDDAHSSLGDWYVNKNKLKNGLANLVDKITNENMQFGLWFEPEMVSPDSKLYEMHPDWCIHVPERSPKATRHQRNQLVLDLSRKEVRDYIVKAVCDILSSAKISYVKWDMNRSITDCGSAMLETNAQGELFHRYVLGLYEVIEQITDRFPNILFESCASGGGRFDPGMLYYMPQTWTSDDTDAIERLKIQYGTSMVYPVSAMGAHISECPNHQVGRTTSLTTRGDVAMSGNFGYEFDLTKLTEEEKALVKQQTAYYKNIRHIVQFGELYRSITPYDGDGNEVAYTYVSNDKSEAVVFSFRILAKPNTKLSRIKVKGLASDKTYQIVGTEKKYRGDQLMYVGLERENELVDFKSWKYLLKEV